MKGYYFDSGIPASFSGPHKLYRVLKRKYPGEFSLSFIINWLNSQDAYSLQKPIRHRFKVANVRVAHIGEQFDVDLLSMRNLEKENDGIHYLLCAIDILSRKLWVKPLKNKKAQTVLKAMQGILSEKKPLKIRSDKGSDFANQWFKKYMKEKNIYFFTTQNPPKANYVERVQRTIKTALYRMMRHRRNYRYIDDLDKIVANYNASPHRSLGYLAPNDVNKENEADVWAHIYLKRPQQRRGRKYHKPTFRLKKGDLVRISFVKQPFRRAYQEQYTTEVFKIANRLLKQGIPMYSLKDLNGEDIKGLFYNAELQKVNKDENSLWLVEKIIKRRRRNKKLQYFLVLKNMLRNIWKARVVYIYLLLNTDVETGI